MIVGIVAALLCLLDAAVFAANRGKWKIRSFFRKIHRPVGLILCAVSVVHLILVLRLLRQRPLWMTIAGILLLLCVLLLALSYFFRKKLGSRWLKLHRMAAAALLVCLCVHVALGVTGFSQYQREIGAIQISDVDLSKVADGDYFGSCDVQYISARVEVHVRDGAITEISLLEHRNERGAAAESIPKTIVAEQHVRVDAVSGATNSSKVIEKAVENALESAKLKAG